MSDEWLIQTMSFFIAPIAAAFRLTSESTAHIRQEVIARYVRPFCQTFSLLRNERGGATDHSPRSAACAGHEVMEVIFVRYCPFRRGPNVRFYPLVWVYSHFRCLGQPQRYLVPHPHPGRDCLHSGRSRNGYQFAEHPVRAVS